MTTTASVDLFGFRKITKKGLLESCKKNKLYRTPSLNDVLYLHYQGFEDIECLEEYTGLKCIWLECNAIMKISGLDNQKLLKCLFLHNNVIKKIENLEHCPELDTINLSHNHITKIENCGIDKLPVLTSLNLSHNYLKTYDSLINLVDCKMISVLDLANNRIDDILCIKIFAQMPELRVLVLQGNPVVNQIPQYRKTLILDCVNLTYLDSRPVFPRDRACAEAWKQGGYEAERIEHARWNREERKKIRQSVNATLRLKNRGGGDPQAHLLMSSDDEDAGITELSSAPSLEKDQINAAAGSSQILKCNDDDDDDEDSDNHNNCSIPLFNMITDNKQSISLLNTEKRCIVCSRLDCNDEHKKKRKRIWNVEEPEIILENSFIFNMEVECHQETTNNTDFNEENKLYNDIYRQNIQYINEAVPTGELNNDLQDSENISGLSSLGTMESSTEKDAIHITELSGGENISNMSKNSSQLLVRPHDQASDLTELSSAPPMKKCKLNDPLPNSSHEQSDLNEEHIKEQLQENETENILGIFNTNSDEVDNGQDKLLTKDNIYDNIYKTNAQYISEIVENEMTSNAEIPITTDSIDSNNTLATDEIKNIETNNSVSYIRVNNEIHSKHDVESQTSNSVNNQIISKNNIGKIISKNDISDINLVIAEVLQSVNVTRKTGQLKDNCSLKLINTLPAVFSSKLYLGTDTKINSAIALYEMSNRKALFNTENISAGFDNIRNEVKESHLSITANDKDYQTENDEPKLEIINRLLNNPITKTFKYDTSKINDEFEILKTNETETNNNSRLKTFLDIQNKKNEINHAELTSETEDIQTRISKSETILQNCSNKDDESKNMMETHSSDTRILKINYNI